MADPTLDSYLTYLNNATGSTCQRVRCKIDARALSALTDFEWNLVEDYIKVLDDDDYKLDVKLAYLDALEKVAGLRPAQRRAQEAELVALEKWSANENEETAAEKDEAVRKRKEADADIDPHLDTIIQSLKELETGHEIAGMLLRSVASEKSRNVTIDGPRTFGL